MAHNWKKPFKTQLSQYKNKINRERQQASLSIENKNEDDIQ